MNTSVNRPAIVGAGVVGACVPFVWVVVALFLFSVFTVPQDGWWFKLLMVWLPTLLCPPLLFAQEPGFWLWTAPFLNGLLYALIAYLHFKAKSVRARRAEQTAKPPV